MVGVIVILSVIVGVLAHAAGAGMTVLGLGVIGFTIAVIWADSAELVPSGGLGKQVRRVMWISVGVCTISLLAAVGLFFAHASNTGAFVAAFASALLLGGASVYGVLR